VPGPSADLTGTFLSADKPIQVLAGHQCAHLPESAASCNHLEEAMLPEEVLAQEALVTIPLVPSTTPGSPPTAGLVRVRVLATEPGTFLGFQPNGIHPDMTLQDRGDFVDLALRVEDFLVTADKPILAMQFLDGQSGSDPSMAIVVPPHQYRPSYRFHTPGAFAASFVNVVCPMGAATLLDGTPLNGFTRVGNSAYGVSRIALTPTPDGTHTLTSDMRCGLSVYGFGPSSTYWHPAGLDLALQSP
jgi:hypothetical protein